MKKLEKKLTLLKPWQIAALAVVALTVGLLASVTLGGVVATLLTPFNYTLAGAVGVVVSLGGVVWSVQYMTQPFVHAFYRRRMEDDLYEVFVKYAEDKESNIG